MEGIANFGQDQKVFVRRPGDAVNVYTQWSLLSVADQGLASLVYLETKDRFNVNSATEWVGTVYASVLELNGTDETFVGQNINVWGGLYAFDSVDVRGGSIVNYIRSYLAPQVAATPAPAALALLGSALIAAAAITARRKRLAG